MAVQESSAERVRRFQAKVTSSLNYVLAAAQSGKGFKTELMEGASELLDNTQHFMNSVTALVVTSGSEATEVREEVTAKRYELCGQLAELIRICDKMILSEEIPSTAETESFANKITQLAEELMVVIAPLIERRLSAGGTVRGQASPQRAVRHQHGNNWEKHYSLTIGRTRDVAKDRVMQSLPTDTFMDGRDNYDSGYSQNGESQFRQFTMPKSLSRRRGKLTRRPSGGNLFEVRHETTAEVLIPGEIAAGRTRLRSTSHGEAGPPPKPSSSAPTSLSTQRGLSTSSPILNQIKKQADPSVGGGGGLGANSDKQSLQRTISSSHSRHAQLARCDTVDMGMQTLPPPQRHRSTSHPKEPAPPPPLLPPKKRPQTPVSRNVIVSDLFANATPPPRGPNLSTRYPPSPPIFARSSSLRSGTVTEIRVDSPESWSPSESPAPGSLSSSSSQVSSHGTLTSSSTSSPYSQAGTPRHLVAPDAASTAASPSAAGAPPKPFHPTLPSSRPQSAMVDLASPPPPPDKPPHPTLRKNRSSKVDVVPDGQPPPAKPPRPPTLTFNPDNPPPLPPKKKALLNYLEQFGTYSSPTDQDLDFAPRIRIGSVSSPQVGTPGHGAPVVAEQNGTPSPMVHGSPGAYRKIPVSRTRSVFGSELNFPPPLPVKTRKGSTSLKRNPTIRSTNSGRRDVSIEEEPEPKRAESPPQLPVGSGDSGVHTSSERLSEEDVISQSSSPEGYQEQEASSNLLYYSDVGYYLVFNEDAEGHSLLGGPVDALIAHAAADQKHESDRLYHEAFLLTYRTFIEPDILIEKLLERHDTFLEDSNDVICHATLSLLLRVVDEIKGSMDKSITQRLLDTVFRLLCDNELKLGQLLHNKLFENLKAKGQGLRLAREALASSRGPPPSDWSITRFRSRQVAQQLTLIDFAFYNAVEVHECLTWSVHQSEERCPTLTAFTEHFNNVSYWVRTRLLDAEKKSEREKVMHKFIKVIEHLREMNNFNSMFALLAAMDCAAVNRMPWPKEAIKSLEEPRKIIDNLNGFKNYRDALAAGGSPCIPYLGLYLQDLTFIHIGNSNMLDDNKDCVNFAKRWRQFKVMCKVKQYQQHGYEVTKRDEDIIQYFNGFSSHLGEEELWERSIMLKPRGQQ